MEQVVQVWGSERVLRLCCVLGVEGESVRIEN